MVHFAVRINMFNYNSVLYVGDYRTIVQQYEERNMMRNTVMSLSGDSILQLIGAHRCESNEIHLISTSTPHRGIQMRNKCVLSKIEYCRLICVPTTLTVMYWVCLCK
jgi:hypothetical protein